ncbi:MAG: arsenate reductase (glutaredoxin) [Corynebacterium sp.]|nr:arsenate reductase (glutaredoxin) [Corynebacterium sp.]
MQSTIYHYSACSKSRAALQYLREQSIEPTVIEYVKNPPTEETLIALLKTANLKAHQAIRTNEPIYAELGLSENTPEKELIAAMVAHPILIERPIVITTKGACIARPTERINEIL